MGHRLSLRANFSWTFVGNVVNGACQWGKLAALARFGSPEMVGQFSLALAVGAPVIMLANLQLRGVQATDARQSYDFGDYLALRLLTSFGALLVISTIALAAGYGRETALVILAIAVFKTLQSLIDVFHGLLQQRERMDLIARSIMVRGVLSFLGLAVLTAVTHRVVYGVLGMVLSNVLVLLLYDVRNARRVLVDCLGTHGALLRPRWSARRLLGLATLALPLGLSMMLISLNTNIPRYVIERALGERGLGFFAAMAYLQVAGATVVGALGQSASPRLASLYAQGNRRAFVRLLMRLLGIGAALGAGGVLLAVLFGRQVLTLLYGLEYAQQPQVFVCLMVASGVAYVSSFLGYGMTAARLFKPQLPIFATVAGVTALGCLCLVPTRGLLGAALALIISSGVNCFLSSLVLLRALRSKPASAS